MFFLQHGTLLRAGGFTLGEVMDRSCPRRVVRVMAGEREARIGYGRGVIVPLINASAWRTRMDCDGLYGGARTAADARLEHSSYNC